MLAGGLSGLGLTPVLARLLPAEPDVANPVERVSSTRSRATARLSAARSGKERLGLWGLRVLPPGLWVRTPTRELALLRISVAQFYAEKVTFAGLGLVIPPGLTLLFRSLGLGIPLQIPALASIGLAAVMLFMPNYNALGSLLGASSRVSCSHAPDRGHRLHRTALARSCIGHGQPSSLTTFMPRSSRPRTAPRLISTDSQRCSKQSRCGPRTDGPARSDSMSLHRAAIRLVAGCSVRHCLRPRTWVPADKGGPSVQVGSTGGPHCPGATTRRKKPSPTYWCSCLQHRRRTLGEAGVPLWGAPKWNAHVATPHSPMKDESDRRAVDRAGRPSSRVRSRVVLLPGHALTFKSATTAWAARRPETRAPWMELVSRWSPAAYNVAPTPANRTGLVSWCGAGIAGNACGRS